MKEIKNIVLQISEEQHLSEERFVCNFIDNGVDNNIIINKVDLNVDELAVYDAFIALVNTKLID